MVACVVFPFPCVHFVCCWSRHSSTIPLLAGTLLLFWSVHKPASLISLVVRAVLLCVAGFSLTSPNSGAKSWGGFSGQKNRFFHCFVSFLHRFLFFPFYFTGARETQCASMDVVNKRLINKALRYPQMRSAGSRPKEFSANPTPPPPWCRQRGFSPGDSGTAMQVPDPPIFGVWNSVMRLILINQGPRLPKMRFFRFQTDRVSVSAPP